MMTNNNNTRGVKTWVEKKLLEADQNVGDNCSLMNGSESVGVGVWCLSFRSGSESGGQALEVDQRVKKATIRRWPEGYSQAANLTSKYKGKISCLQRMPNISLDMLIMFLPGISRVGQKLPYPYPTLINLMYLHH